MLLFFISFLYLHVILIFILLLFFICHFSSSTFSSRHHPSPFCGLFPGSYTRFILSAQPIVEWFATLSFSTIPLSSCRGRYGLEWAFFYPQAFFASRFFTGILTCVYRGLPGSWKFFLEVCRASYWSWKHRPGPSVCLIHINPQSSYSKRLSFKSYHISSWIACSESLIYLLLARFELFWLVQSICKDYQKHSEQD